MKQEKLSFLCYNNDIVTPDKDNIILILKNYTRKGVELK